MNIRSCHYNEIETIVELLKQTGLYLDYMDSPPQLAKKLAFDPESILVATFEVGVVGVAITIYDPWLSFIFHVAVSPNHRRSGVGEALVREAVQRLKAKGTSEVAAYIVEDNIASRAMFQKLKWIEYQV
jgi:hypothetical protein